MAKQERITIHAALATWIIFTVIFSFAFITGVVKVFEYKQYLDGSGIFVMGLAFVLYICARSVYLEGEKFTYCMFFVIRRSIDLETVTKVKIVSNPAPMLVLQRKHSKPFKFVIKPFSKAGVAMIMHHIRLHAPNAEFDKVSSDLEQGDFASVTRQTLQVQNLFQLFGTVIVTMLVLGLARATTHSMPLTVGIIAVAVLILIIIMSRKKRN